METIHEPVLLHEVVATLTGYPAESEARSTKNGGLSDVSSFSVPRSPTYGMPWYLDGTLGGAGHALAISKALGGRLNIVGLDRDPQAVKRAGKTLTGKAQKIVLENADFRNIDTILDKNGIAAVDMILLDLGISSYELETSGRGFTFQKDEPLLMTLGDPADYAFTAKDIVNGWEEDVIANIIFGYAEEKFARRIARTIVGYRGKKKIETSGELAEIVRNAAPPFYRRAKIHPATKTFQALRIAVNDELNALREGLAQGFSRLNSGGRMAVISFHSLEDRIVKDFFRAQAAGKAEGSETVILTKKPLTAGEQEKAENPRSRSAKLRVIQK